MGPFAEDRDNRWMQGLHDRDWPKMPLLTELWKLFGVGSTEIPPLWGWGRGGLHGLIQAFHEPVSDSARSMVYAQFRRKGGLQRFRPPGAGGAGLERGEEYPVGQAGDRGLSGRLGIRVANPGRRLRLWPGLRNGGPLGLGI